MKNGPLRGRCRLSFSFTPLRLAIWCGLLVLGMALCGILYALALRFFFDPSHWVRGWASLFVAVLFMGGVQLISLGIIGEYVGCIYGDVKQRPLYFIWERFGFRDDPLPPPVTSRLRTTVRQDQDI